MQQHYKGHKLREVTSIIRWDKISRNKDWGLGKFKRILPIGPLFLPRQTWESFFKFAGSLQSILTPFSSKMSIFGCLPRMSSLMCFFLSLPLFFFLFLFVSSFVGFMKLKGLFFLHSGSALPSRIESSLSPAAWLAHFSNVNTRSETSQPERLEPKPPTPYVNKQIPRISQKGHILHYWTARVVSLVIITCNQNMVVRWASLRCLRKQCWSHGIMCTSGYAQEKNWDIYYYLDTITI